MDNYNQLLDSYSITGTDYSDFAKNLTDFSSTIRYVKVNSADLATLTFLGADKSDACHFYKTNITNVNVFSNLIVNALENAGYDIDGYSTKNAHTIFCGGNVCMPAKTIPHEAASVLEEMTKSTKLMMEVNGDTMFTSKSLFTTLNSFGLKGTFLVKSGCLSRDMAVMSEFAEKSKPVTLIIRKIGGIKKILSILSERYEAIDQKVILDIIEDITKDGSLGKPVCRNWEISQFVTKIYLDFPEKAKDIENHYGKTDKFIPGICIMSSDTGDCSLKILGTFRHGNSLTVQDEVLHKHIGKIDIQSIIKKVEENIFAEFAKLPDKLCELLTVDISDTTWDLSNPANQNRNVERYKEVMTDAFKQLKIVEAVGVKAKKILLEQLVYRACPDVYYTAYDICVDLMSLPEKVKGLASLPQLQKAVGRAPYISYDKAPTIVVTA